MKHWRDLSLRSKIFLCFGTLILLSTAAITLYAVSITISELDAYALQSMERNAQYVSREISALLRNTQMQSVLFASDKTVDEALAGYDAKTTLQKWESWSALQKTVPCGWPPNSWGTSASIFTQAINSCATASAFMKGWKRCRRWRGARGSATPTGTCFRIRGVIRA